MPSEKTRLLQLNTVLHLLCPFFTNEKDSDNERARMPKTAKTLRAAALSGDVARVTALLAQGADIEARNANGNTALHLAAAQGRVAVVSALLKAGARADATGRAGKSSLDFAIAGGYPSIVAMMLDAGVRTHGGRVIPGADTPCLSTRRRCQLQAGDMATSCFRRCSVASGATTSCRRCTSAPHTVTPRS
jgi:ankyrin repeat protein